MQIYIPEPNKEGCRKLREDLKKLAVFNWKSEDHSYTYVTVAEETPDEVELSPDAMFWLMLERPSRSCGADSVDSLATIEFFPGGKARIYCHRRKGGNRGRIVTWADAVVKIVRHLKKEYFKKGVCDWWQEDPTATNMISVVIGCFINANEGVNATRRVRNKNHPVQRIP